MKCNTCGDYIAKAKKFNARKETVEGEEYLGLKIYRFYFKCPICMAEITFKTDPKNQDYELEHGATRNFQAYRLAEMQAQQEAKNEEEEEKLNPMKLLEKRTQASRREMQAIEDLEELKELSQRTVHLDTEDFLERQQERNKKIQEMVKKQEEEEDEETLRELLEQQNKALLQGDIHSKGSEEEEEEVEVTEEQEKEAPKLSVFSLKSNELSETKSSNSLKRKLPQLIRVVKKQPQKTATTSGLSSLCNYSDSESD